MNILDKEIFKIDQHIQKATPSKRNGLRLSW